MSAMDFWPYGMTLRAVIPWHQFQQAPLCWLLRRLDELRIACKSLARYEYDNHHQVISFSPYPIEFSFSVNHEDQQQPGSIRDNEYRSKFGRAYTATNVFSLHLWDSTGTRRIWNDKAFLADITKPIPAEVLKAAEDALNAYCKGELSCSDCGAMLPLTDMPGRYFAGTYCTACWLGERGDHKGRGGWKAVEARETYD